MTLSARARIALLMTVAVYPVVVAYVSLISVLTPGWEFWQRSFLIVPLMTTTIVFVVMPFITARFGAFIAGRKRSAAA